MATRKPQALTALMAQHRDPEGFAALRAAVPHLRDGLASLVSGHVAMILAAKGGTIADITLGDFLDFVEVRAAHGAERDFTAAALLYDLLRTLGIFPSTVPQAYRMFAGRARGRYSVEELVDLNEVRCRPVRDLLVDYLREREATVDYSTLASLADYLVRLFWRDLELHHPRISSLHLALDVAAAWKRRITMKTVTVTNPDGTTSTTEQQRNQAVQCLLAVRGFYVDLARWAVEEPARWGPWAAPSPVSRHETMQRRHKKRTKSRMDQRTRERLPLLPALVAHVARRRAETAAALAAGQAAEPGKEFTVDGKVLRRVSGHHGQILFAVDADGQRHNLTRQEDQAFWTWAVVEVLRHTGVRCEEMLELSHHSFVQYRLPDTGDLVPLLHVLPSKTDTERLLLIDPELADVLAGIVARIRLPDGSVPQLVAYDESERRWNDARPLLFQRQVGSERRPIGRHPVRQMLHESLADLGAVDATGAPLRLTPHDFRRMFVTEAIASGLPPHIAQIVCGHADINTTMGYKAVYPADAVNAHRAFLARRRNVRPGDEYRTPTDEEWTAFLGHFELRKVALGTCGRAYATPCVHEHSCVRCPMLRPDPAQRDRLAEICANLVDASAKPSVKAGAARPKDSPPPWPPPEKTRQARQPSHLNSGAAGHADRAREVYQSTGELTPRRTEC